MRATTSSLLALALLATACAAAADARSNADEPTSAPPATGMCLEGAPDCVDTVVDPDANSDVDEGAVIAEAKALLGGTQAEVLNSQPAIRLSRAGDEHFALTEDYVLGRMTVATDDDGTGTFRVVEVVVELTDGPVVMADTN